MHIKVSSLSFCKNNLLRAELEQHFDHVSYWNESRVATSVEMEQFIEDADGLILGTEVLSQKAIQKAPRLKVVSKYGVGLDNVDQQALQNTGIHFGFTPGVNRLCVAELALCFLLGLTHNVFWKGFLLKQGIWEKDGGILCKGRTIGILGFGNVGQQLAKLLQGFDVNLLACDIEDRSQQAQELNVTMVDQETLFQRSEVLSLHVPLTELTSKIIHSGNLATMPKGSFLINTARGALINENDLLDALESQHLSGAALDVFEIEPPKNEKLLSHPRLMVTPHIGGNAREAKLAMGRSAIDHIVRFATNSGLMT